VRNPGSGNDGSRETYEGWKNKTVRHAISGESRRSTFWRRGEDIRKGRHGNRDGEKEMLGKTREPENGANREVGGQRKANGGHSFYN